MRLCVLFDMYCVVLFGVLMFAVFVLSVCLFMCLRVVFWWLIVCCCMVCVLMFGVCVLCVC